MTVCVHISRNIEIITAKNVIHIFKEYATVKKSTSKRGGKNSFSDPAKLLCLLLLQQDIAKKGLNIVNTAMKTDNKIEYDDGMLKFSFKRFGNQLEIP